MAALQKFRSGLYFPLMIAHSCTGNTTGGPGLRSPAQVMKRNGALRLVTEPECHSGPGRVSLAVT
eukprot:2910883-Rhodomonas_salina.1